MTTTSKHTEPTQGHLTDQIANASIQKQEKHGLNQGAAIDQRAVDERAIDEADARASKPAQPVRHVPGPTPPANADPAHYDNLHAGGWTPAEIAARAVADLESISVQPSGLQLVTGDIKQLAATGTFKGQTSRDIGPAVTWVSDHAEIASVTGNGLVTAVSIGSAVLTASNGPKSANVSVTVTGPLAAKP